MGPAPLVLGRRSALRRVRRGSWRRAGLGGGEGGAGGGAAQTLGRRSVADGDEPGEERKIEGGKCEYTLSGRLSVIYSRV